MADDDNSEGRSPPGFAERLELATRGLLELSMRVLGEIEERVSPSHLRALQSLERLGGGAKVTSLGVALGVPPSTASRISDRLTADGLITRAVAPGNRRATWLELTPAGRAVLDDMVTARADALEQVTKAMPTGKRQALLAGTEAFAEAYRCTRTDDDQRSGNQVAGGDQPGEDGTSLDPSGTPSGRSR